MDVLLPPDDLSQVTRELLSRHGVRETLEGLALRPSRRMGQSFLVEPAVLHHILQAAAVTPRDAVLEVGPGLGVLTGELLRRAGRVVAVELDRRLAAWLRRRLGDQPQLTLVEGDILRHSPGDLLAGAPYSVVANLPYAITSPVLRHLLEARPAPARIVVLVQWEVAQRIAATPPDMSMLALAVQLHARPEIVARVPAGCFYPVPQVDSAVLRLEVGAQQPLEVPGVELLRLARLAFAHPRQQLGKTLSQGLGWPRADLDAALIAAGVAPQRRPETVSLEEWGRLCVDLAPRPKD